MFSIQVLVNVLTPVSSVKRRGWVPHAPAPPLAPTPWGLGDLIQPRLKCILYKLCLQFRGPWTSNKIVFSHFLDKIRSHWTADFYLNQCTIFLGISDRLLLVGSYWFQGFQISPLRKFNFKIFFFVKTRF